MFPFPLTLNSAEPLIPVNFSKIALAYDLNYYNINNLDDIKNAITENTALILYVHTSNYKIRGFTQMPSIKEIKKHYETLGI